VGQHIFIEKNLCLIYINKIEKESTMSPIRPPITVPDHDTLIEHIQNFVILAVDKVGWPEVREICENYDISPALVRRVYLWDTADRTSFNFRKLIEVYDFAYDVVNDYKVRPKNARR
jgi:hypothetical protein